MPPEGIPLKAEEVMDEEKKDSLATLENSLPTASGTPEAIHQFLEATRLLARDRRRKRTPKSLIKRKPIDNKGTTAPYVDRPEYQKWLDENFPGWSIEGEPKFWTETISSGELSQPVLFNCSIVVRVVESNGLVRKIPGVGSASVSAKELGRENTYLLGNKYVIAQTNAYKQVCAWLGAFFDLRADEEARERSATETTAEQNARFAELLKDVPIEMKDITKSKWATQNATSAIDFLNILASKVKQLKEQEDARGAKATSGTSDSKPQ